MSKQAQQAKDLSRTVGEMWHQVLKLPPGSELTLRVRQRTSEVILVELEARNGNRGVIERKTVDDIIRDAERFPNINFFKPVIEKLNNSLEY